MKITKVIKFIILCALTVGMPSYASNTLPSARDIKATIHQIHSELDVLDYKSAFDDAKSIQDVSPIAQSLLGYLYAEGLGVNKNCDKALKLINLSTKSRRDIGLSNLGALYETGACVETNPDKALSIYNKIESKRLRNLSLAYHYFKTNDYKRAKSLYTITALGGNYSAQRALADLYQEDKYGPPDFISAYMWYQIAIINGSQRAKNNFFDTHIKQGMKEAPYCYGFGQSNVAMMYLNGKAGLPQSNSDAFAWMQEAYTSYPDAAAIEANMARFYWLGIGTSVDPDKAFKLMSTAAQKPFGPAQQMLGDFYARGVGVQADKQKAIAWYKKAIETYKHPDNSYFEKKYNAACRPKDLTTDKLNSASAQESIDNLMLS